VSQKKNVGAGKKQIEKQLGPNGAIKIFKKPSQKAKKQKAPHLKLDEKNPNCPEIWGVFLFVKN